MAQFKQQPASFVEVERDMARVQSFSLYNEIAFVSCLMMTMPLLLIMIMKGTTENSDHRYFFGDISLKMLFVIRT